MIHPIASMAGATSSLAWYARAHYAGKQWIFQVGSPIEDKIAFRPSPTQDRSGPDASRLEH
jgi:hypothetical protein